MITAPQPPAQTGTAPRDTIRLSLRELRELPYRAFRVAGASHGEALAAADATQHAELFAGTGLAAAVASCRRGWMSSELSVHRAQGPSGEHGFEVPTAQPLDPLQLGTALIDLASCAEVPGSVTVRTLPIGPAIDAPLRLAARRSGFLAFAARRSETGIELRLATPAGDLAAVEDGDPGRELGIGETLIATSTAAAHDLINGTALTSAAELHARRMAASSAGVHADTATWAELLAIASDFKQPDRENPA